MRWFRYGLPVSGPFVCRCLTSHTVLRFHSPLIEPDVRFSRIRLSDKVSHVRTHNMAWSGTQLGKPQPLVQILPRET